jgi:hypothetical protein
MAYNKTNWTDRQVQKPMTFIMVTNADGTITLQPAEGTIIQSGTPITAANMNNIETQYDQAVSWVQANYPDAQLLKYRGDWNSADDITWLFTPGVYSVFDGGSAHYSFPAPSVLYRYGTLMVMTSNSATSQLYFEHSKGNVYQRNRWGASGTNNWTSWKRIISEGDNLVADRLNGLNNSEIVYLGSGAQGQCRVDTTGTSWRMGMDGNSYLRQDIDGSFTMVIGGVSRHVFKPDGSKSGGTIMIDGINLGMSPIDSPQYLIEAIVWNVDLTAEGTRVDLDLQFRKAVANYGVFPSRGEVVEENEDYFIIKGTGKAHCRIVGERTGYEGVFWTVIKSEGPLSE